MESIDLAKNLRELLEEEAEALTSRNISLLERLQTRKENLLNTLEIAHRRDPSSGQHYLDTIQQCSDLMRRNGTIISTQLGAIRLALGALTNRHHGAQDVTYDRRGIISAA